ncbi:hypothetical protein HAX54_033037, partial [Datura stramonium]|nr:hypothetical protein [Datura stramonium]
MLKSEGSIPMSDGNMSGSCPREEVHKPDVVVVSRGRGRSNGKGRSCRRRPAAAIGRDATDLAPN